MFSMDPGYGESSGHVVVALHGELDLVDAPGVAAALRVIAAREPRIIVDLTGLVFIDASGVGALRRGRKHARNAGGDLFLAAPQRQVRLVLSIIWEASGSRLHSSVAEAAAGTGTLRPGVVPSQRQPR
jgi:anti-sigma B factor antagonist